MNFDAWVYKGLLSDCEFHENWHRKSLALLTVVLHIMLLDHENLCSECHTFTVAINEIIFAHVPGWWHFESKEALVKSVPMWSTLFAILLLSISFSLRLTSEIKKIVNLKWYFNGILLWVKISYFIWWAKYMCLCWSVPYSYTVEINDTDTLQCIRMPHNVLTWGK